MTDFDTLKLQYVRVSNIRLPKCNRITREYVNELDGFLLEFYAPLDLIIHSNVVTSIPLGLDFDITSLSGLQLIPMYKGRTFNVIAELTRSTRFGVCLLVKEEFMDENDLTREAIGSVSEGELLLSVMSPSHINLIDLDAPSECHPLPLEVRGLIHRLGVTDYA